LISLTIDLRDVGHVQVGYDFQGWGGSRQKHYSKLLQYSVRAWESPTTSTLPRNAIL